LKTRRDIIRLSGTAISSIMLDGWHGVRADERTSAPEESETTDAEDAAMTETDVPHPGAPTLGGMQFWGDVCYFHGCRIQRYIYNGHCRLLDSNNRRYQSGTLEECQETLDQIRRASEFKADTGHAVIYLHGLGRTSRSMRPILDAMPKEGFVHIPFEYPSTRVPIEDSAGFLHSVIESLTAVSKISFVVHSMGGLVVRQYLKEHKDPRIQRLVMLGTPNSGAEMADMLKRNFVFRTIYGPAGQQLVTDHNGTIKSLPIPEIEFAVIAGGKGDERGFNPLLPGDDDGTVTVASARLPGAADFLLVPKLHSFLMSDETAIAAAKCFVEHGRFSLERNPEPIVKDTVACP